jgi:hypothetical protein
VRRFLVTASVVPSSPILVTLMKEALSSSETSVLTAIHSRVDSKSKENPPSLELYLNPGPPEYRCYPVSREFRLMVVTDSAGKCLNHWEVLAMSRGQLWFPSVLPPFTKFLASMVNTV